MAVNDARSIEDRNWDHVQSFFDGYSAWVAKRTEVIDSDESEADKARRLNELDEEFPDVSSAVTAARAIAENGGDRALDAANFLVKYTDPRSPTAASDQELGMATLQAAVGADWSLVESYKKDRAAYDEKLESIVQSDMSDDEKDRQFELLGDPPIVQPTMAAAALATAELGPKHNNAIEAAAFVIENCPVRRTKVKAARVMARHFPDDNGWPHLVFQLGWDSVHGQDKETDEFLAELASNSPNRIVRAVARYFRGWSMAESLNDRSLTTKQRDPIRQEALKCVTGLSVGVENELVPIIVPDGVDWKWTFAQAEADLLHTIRHASVGSIVADEVGLRLDGTEDRLFSHSGKVLLIDFWGVWCGFCAHALPDLRELVAKYPTEQFAILSISTDDDAETVTTFMENEPMPWSHWRVVREYDLVHKWCISLYPTYVVINPDGEILFRGLFLDHAKQVLKQLLEEPAAQT